MKLFERLNRNIDYNNHYTLKKAVVIMETEFNIAVKKKNIMYGREISDAAKKIYQNLSSMYRESEDYGNTMSYMQKVWAKRLRGFIAYLEKQLN